MKIIAYVVAALVALAGAVFLLQGLRFLPSALMYGKPEWVVIGGIMVAGSVVAIMWLWRRP